MAAQVDRLVLVGGDEGLGSHCSFAFQVLGAEVRCLNVDSSTHEVLGVVFALGDCIASLQALVVWVLGAVGVTQCKDGLVLNLLVEAVVAWCTLNDWCGEW